MSTDIAGVVERLRAFHFITGEQWGEEPKIIAEAADLIESLSAQVAAQNKELARLRAGIGLLADPETWGASINISTAPIQVKASDFCRMLLNGDQT